MAYDFIIYVQLFFGKIKTRGLHFSGRKSILGAIRGGNGERLTIVKYALGKGFLRFLLGVAMIPMASKMINAGT